MPVEASNKGGASFQLAPVGNHLAICVQVIDLGTQEEEYAGKPKVTRKVRLGFELPEEKAVFDEARGEECFMVAKEYTLSLNEKANLRHDIESWRGVAFTEAELEGFLLGKLLGAPAMVNVVHKKSRNNRMYTQITSVTRLPKSIKKANVPKPTLPLIEYSIDDEQNEVFKALPDFLKEKIMASIEARGVGQKASNDASPTGPDEDEIPF